MAALNAGASGLGPLRWVDGARVNVAYGYHVLDGETEAPLRASRWLADCVAEAVASSGVNPARERVVALVGTGLRELRAVERYTADGIEVATERLHFGAPVRDAVPGLYEVVTISNACSAAGSALALAQDMVELGDADAVVVGGADAMTESMLAMIGRVADAPTDAVRPFDADRRGVLLGEGAAVVVVVPEGRAGVRPLARLLSTGLSCDAYHETAPAPDGIRRAMRDALDRAGRAPGDVDLVVAHGTGTQLNDPTEADAIRAVLGTPGPLVTAVKGAVGHTSGGAALLGVAVALDCFERGSVPPVAGLREPIEQAAGLRLVRGRPELASVRLAQVNAFGFGGLNAVTLLERVA
jgi:3-oxoacyl-[acyl-carrier-protein] synthase II